MCFKYIPRFISIFGAPNPRLMFILSDHVVWSEIFSVAFNLFINLFNSMIQFLMTTFFQLPNSTSQIKPPYYNWFSRSQNNKVNRSKVAVVNWQNWATVCDAKTQSHISSCICIANTFNIRNKAIVNNIARSAPNNRFFSRKNPLSIKTFKARISGSIGKTGNPNKARHSSPRKFLIDTLHTEKPKQVKLPPPTQIRGINSRCHRKPRSWTTNLE